MIVVVSSEPGTYSAQHTYTSRDRRKKGREGGEKGRRGELVDRQHPLARQSRQSNRLDQYERETERKSRGADAAFVKSTARLSVFRNASQQSKSTDDDDDEEASAGR
jgi:hypothetical protein